MPILNTMGMKKALLYFGGLVLATAGPITMFSATDLLADIKKSWLSGSSATAVVGPQESPTVTPPADVSASSLPQGTPAPSTSATASLPKLSEVLRFNVTVEWVMRRWPRVSTGLPHLQLQGYRVPLVTGTGLSDVAGSLTYYFNARQEVQRITLRGTTGDPGALVGLVAKRHRFARRLTNNPGVVLYESVDSSNRSVGSLKIQSAKVIRADQPYTRFEVDLAMDRPQ